jgi:hypothetical protein
VKNLAREGAPEWLRLHFGMPRNSKDDPIEATAVRMVCRLYEVTDGRPMQWRMLISSILGSDTTSPLELRIEGVLGGHAVRRRRDMGDGDGA